MKITIESTKKIFTINGIPTRLWLGRSEKGTSCNVFVAAISVNSEDIHWNEFEDVLNRIDVPKEIIDLAKD